MLAREHARIYSLVDTHLCPFVHLYSLLVCVRNAMQVCLHIMQYRASLSTNCMLL